MTPWERVIEADPEVLLVAPCGFGIARTLREMHVLVRGQIGVTCGRCVPAE